MRTDNKYKLVGALAGAGLGATLSIAYQKNQLEEKEQDFSWDNLNGWQAFVCAGLGALLGSAVGDILYKYKVFHKENPGFNPTSFLISLLKEQSLKSDPDHLKFVVKYREQVKNTLNSFYRNSLVEEVLDVGSFKNRTAIASGYDVDLIAPFRKKSFRTLASMHNHVYKTLREGFGRNAFVVQGKKTIGVTFKEKGREIHFDIAPGREINNFKKDGKLNMYVSAEGFWETDSSMKIDVGVQKNIAINKPEAREVIRLIKLYCLRNSLNIPPVIITQVTVKAIGNPYTSYSKIDNLMEAMGALADSLRQSSIKDLSNSNNNLLDKMNDSERERAIDLILSDINKIEDDHGYIKEIFKD